MKLLRPRREHRAPGTMGLSLGDADGKAALTDELDVVRGRPCDLPGCAESTYPSLWLSHRPPRGRRREGGMRAFGLDVHRDFCEVAVAEGGEISPDADRRTRRLVGRPPRAAAHRGRLVGGRPRQVLTMRAQCRRSRATRRRHRPRGPAGELEVILQPERCQQLFHVRQRIAGSRENRLTSPSPGHSQ